MANKVTYKNLFQLVDEQISQKVSFNPKSPYAHQLSRTSVAPFSGNSQSDISTAELVTAIQDILSDAMSPWIISGLTVEATSPLTNNVTVSSGKGAVAGYVYELTENVTLHIPFDNNTEVFYVTLYKDNIYIDKTLNPDRLTVGKIVVPIPGTTSLVQNNKDESWNAYIVNFKEYKLYGYNDKFEEDTIELLRDNISPILADNLIGNIKLSEDLKITNTQGSMELDSAELRILSTNDNTLAKFNRNGTYFYDDNGIEIARFSTTDSRIGNILITKNSIGSADFVSEDRGFRIQDSGYAEFEDVRIRGRISSSVFEYDKVSAVGGKLLVANSTVLAVDVASTDITITVEYPVFSIGEILLIKVGDNEEYMRITNDSSAPTYNVSRFLNRESGESPYTWIKGTAIVSTGLTNSGFIMLDAISQFNPFIDISIRNSSIYNDYSTKVRFGNLSGITDNMYGLLSGYGLYSDNVYLKGKLYAPDIKTAVSGARIELNTSNFLVYDISANQVFNISISGDTSGDITIGDTVEGNYLFWDNSADTLSLCSSTIESGITKKIEIKDGCIIANQLTLQDPTCDCNYSYLDSGYLRFHDRLGDVPYVKRICSGTACTGDTICLVGWITQPRVQVGIKSLLSYKAANSAQDQKWEVNSTIPIWFCTSNTNYGYCFDVNACLILGEGSGGEVVKNANFGVSACTAASVCGTNVKSRFQLWCNNIAPSNYYYGTLCYAICYRINGAGTYCACCFSYVQPHGSSIELKTTTFDPRCMLFSSNETWEIMGYQVSLTFADSGICATGCFLCCYQVACCCCYTVTCCYTCSCQPFTCCACYVINQLPDYNCTYYDYITLTPPANTFCSKLCGCFYFCGTTNDRTTNFCCVEASYSVYAGGGWSTRATYSLACLGEYTMLCSIYDLYDIAPPITCLRMINKRIATPGVISICSGRFSCLDNISITYCYCCVFNCCCTYYVDCCCWVLCGDAASCTYMNLYSLTDTYGCQCVLDNTGCLNWLAISYS